MGTHIYFIRHGNAERATRDQDRQLSEKGKKQAQNRRNQLKNVVFDIAVISPVLRCETTARIILGENSAARIIKKDSMYIPADSTSDGAVIDKVFEQIGYQPLSKYLATEAKEAIKRYGFHNAGVIREVISESPTPITNILVVGHAALLQAIAMEFISEENSPVFNFNVGETEGLLVELESASAVLIQ